MLTETESLPRLLVVDDNPSIHQDIRKILISRTANESLDQLESLMFGDSYKSSSGYNFGIEDAYQGQEALQMVIKARDEQYAYDVAIVDMRMPPGWDGVETIERLWEQDPDLQIIICTAFSDYSWDEIAERLGLHDKLLIIKKPFDDCELLQAARALSVKRRLLNQARYNLDTLQVLVNQRTREIEALHGESARLLNAISSGVVAYDSKGCVTRWNGAAERLFGLPAAQAIARPLVKLPIGWQDIEQVRDFLQLREGGQNNRLEVTLCSMPDSSAVVELTLHPVEGEASERGGLMLADDVTSRKLLEQQLNQAQKLESVGQLAAGIAHEINTPIQYVSDNAEFLGTSMQKLEPILRLLEELSRAEPTDEPSMVQRIRSSLKQVNLPRLLEHIPKAIDDVEHGIQNVARIVQAMKELSHPGTDTPTAVDLNRILESTVVVSRSEWKYIADVELVCGTIPPGLVGYVNQLQQAILNLLINAAHAVDARRTQSEQPFAGKIRLTSSATNDRCLVSIEDNGCGIPPDIRPRVFDPFFTTKGVGKGTGQGLAIAHQVIVKNHQGRLWFESEIGKGTTFFVELPLDTSQAVI